MATKNANNPTSTAAPINTEKVGQPAQVNTPSIEDLQALAGVMKSNTISSEKPRVDFKQLGGDFERNRTPLSERLEQLPFLISAGMVVDGTSTVWGNWHLQAPRQEGRTPVLSFHVPSEREVTSTVRGKKQTVLETGYDRVKVRITEEGILDNLLDLDRLPHFGTLASVLCDRGSIVILWEE